MESKKHLLCLGRVNRDSRIYNDALIALTHVLSRIMKIWIEQLMSLEKSRHFLIVVGWQIEILDLRAIVEKFDQRVASCLIWSEFEIF